MSKTDPFSIEKGKLWNQSKAKIGERRRFCSALFLLLTPKLIRT